MCLSTAVKASNPDEILTEYVSSLSIDGGYHHPGGSHGREKIIRGSLTFADLTGAILKIDIK